jgi:Zn-finger nucleic acid-binding protein
MTPCPRCNGPLTAGEAYGRTIPTCAQCGGRWLDPSDLRAILDEAPLPAASPAPRAPIDLTAAEGLSCPICATSMEPFNYAGDSGVILDRCHNCGGLWLDPGELEAVLTAVAASEQNLDRDVKRFSADLHQAEVRQDALEQQDLRPVAGPLAGPFIGGMADSGPET